MQLDRLSESFGRHRIVVAAAIVAMTIVTSLGFGNLSFDSYPRNIFRAEDSDFASLERLFQEFGSDDNDCILVVEPRDEKHDLFTRESIGAIRHLVATLEALDSVAFVRSLDDAVSLKSRLRPESLLPPQDASEEAFRAAREEAVSHPLLKGQVISEDGKTALVIVRLRGGSLPIDEIQPIVGEVRQIVDAETADSSVRVRLTGVPPIRVEIFDSIQQESQRFMFIGTGLAFVMAIILFRRFWAVIIVASAPILGAVWAMGVMGLINQKINVINVVLPTLVMVVGFTDAVHLMVDIRRSRAADEPPLVCAKSAIRHLGIACALTSLTTAIGFGSLMVAKVDVIRNFGLVCAIGSVLAFTSVMTLVPLLASTRLGRNVHPPHGQDFFGRHQALFERIINWLTGHAGIVALGGTLLTAALGATVFRLHPDNRLLEAIPPENESSRALLHCDRVFGGTLFALIVVEWPENEELASPEVISAITAVQDAFRREPETRYPLSIINVLESIPFGDTSLSERVPLLFAVGPDGAPLVPRDLVSSFARPDLRRAVVMAHLEDRGTAAHMPVFDRIRADLERIEADHKDIHLQLTGTAVVASENINQMIVDLVRSLGLAAVVIFVVMSLVFRSLRLGLISILPNTFPLVATAAILVFLGRPLQLTSVIVFSICLGIAVDDTIHFINRFQREMEVDGDVRAAIRRSFVAVGTALVTTTIVLLTGFGSVVTSTMPTTRLFGWLACVAIGSALIGDLVILPAMLTCFMRSKKPPD